MWVACVGFCPLIKIGCVTLSRMQLESPRAKPWIELLAKHSVTVRSDHSCTPFLWTSVNARRKGGNNLMSAALIPFPGGGFYLNLGDAHRKEEKEFRRSFEGLGGLPPGEPRVFKVSHHGSLSSTSPELLQWIAPTEVWISAGVGNRFGHPTQQVLSWLRQSAALIRRTDIEGDLLKVVSRPERDGGGGNVR